MFCNGEVHVSDLLKRSVLMSIFNTPFTVLPWNNALLHNQEQDMKL